MLTIELRFLSGRYHATPWGHNVNEGLVEWPPSPYRLLRAIVDAWKRRRPDWPAERVEPILQALTVPPKFLLPPASAAHTRSYLNSNKKKQSAQQLIFDAFAVVDRKAPLVMGFDCALPSKSVEDLNALLEQLNYLGRSESWISARCSERRRDIAWNCVASSGETVIDSSEAIQLACVMPPEEHAHLPYKPKSATWLNALCMTTRKILEQGWSVPPALRMVQYNRPDDALRPTLRKPLIAAKTQYQCAYYQLHARVLPPVQTTVQFSERIRSYLMGIHKRIQDNDPTEVSAIFSGKDPHGKSLKGHKHAFYLPLDEDGDGKIDHLMVVAKNPFTADEVMALDRLRSIWQSHGRPDIKIVLVSLSSLREAKHKTRAHKWVSATPFVTTRHHRKGRGSYQEWIEHEIKKECAFHAIPEPSKIEFIDSTRSSHPVRWLEFLRSRKGQAPLRGHGCILTFKKPVDGPFSIGALCHFGLGLFAPLDESSHMREPVAHSKSPIGSQLNNFK